jgi:hypothetical protein
LNEYLKEVNYRIVGKDIEQTIFLNKELSHCRSLDAIHIATALKFRETVRTTADEASMSFYSFDAEMNRLARHYHFATNKI